jgi:hypothetical protein
MSQLRHAPSLKGTRSQAAEQAPVQDYENGKWRDDREEHSSRHKRDVEKVLAL